MTRNTHFIRQIRSPFILSLISESEHFVVSTTHRTKLQQHGTNSIETGRARRLVPPERRDPYPGRHGGPPPTPHCEFL
jgi:hypothetical protein